MSFELPDAIPHLTPEQASELTALLMGVFGKGDAGIAEAKAWLTHYSGVWNEHPLERMKRGPNGVASVIEYLRRCPS